MLALAASLASLALTAPSPAAAARLDQPRPGAAGIGDRLFPTLGNGGYDVLHYDLDLRYATSAPSQSIDGTAKIVARATQPLSRFNLDFGGGAIGSVSVNGRSARWTREGEELVVTPRRPLRARGVFVVRVKHFVATPTAPAVLDPRSTAFFFSPDGSATAPQPNFAHLIFPSNDHPRDKASFAFRFDVPAGTTAVANGVSIGRPRTRAGRTVWRYVQRQPMAAELIQLVMGRFEITSPGRRRGLSLRDVTPPSLTAFMRPILARQPGHIDWMTDRLGRYPFDSYGSVVVDALLLFALETQTLTLYDKYWFTALPQSLWEPTMVHELSHMWFGDSVSPWEWSDVWLNEGHATWYQLHYAQERGFLPQARGVATVEELMRDTYAQSNRLRAQFGPPARPLSADSRGLFSTNVYEGGALVLYALRQKIGDAAFRRLERAWVQRYRYKSASTRDFISLASRVAERDLSAFLHAWLYDATTPPMPGHPTWTVLPVEEPAPASRALATSAQSDALRKR